MKAWLAKALCDWTHGGGSIQRDAEGRINWRCAKCGRWSDSPVPLSEERAAVDRDIREFRVRKATQ